MTPTAQVMAKPERLLAEGRVHIRFATDQLTSAVVLGDHGLYEIEWSRDGGWQCSCPCQRQCSHIRAIAAVTTRAPRVSEATLSG